MQIYNPEEINLSRELIPIDAVYLWCNGSDPKFIRQKQEALANFNFVAEKDNVGDLRFADNEELRFSLRSVYKNAPWINHIFIVTNNQVPSWLEEHPKITIIDHKEIIPREILPTFNSVVIEMFLHLIPGLQEKFLLFNDDMFVGRPIEPSFFFHENLPVVRLRKANRHFPMDIKTAEQLLSDPAIPSFEKTQIRALELAWKEYGVFDPVVLTHTVDSFTKTSIKNTLEKFPEILLHNWAPFRTGDEIQRLIFQLYMAHAMNAPVIISPKISFFQKYLPSFSNRPVDCFEGTECDKVRSRIRSLRPALFCLNSDIHMDKKNREKSKVFFRKTLSRCSPMGEKPKVSQSILL